jgi:hypothetical protein
LHQLNIPFVLFFRIYYSKDKGKQKDL